jgi:hypothetical protein
MQVVPLYFLKCILHGSRLYTFGIVFKHFSTICAEQQMKAGSLFPVSLGQIFSQDSYDVIRYRLTIGLVIILERRRRRVRF